MTSINDNVDSDITEMYEWGQNDDWTEFGDYDCPDLAKKYYTGPHRLDALLVMDKKERMALVCTAIADQVISDWGTVPWTNYYGPKSHGWLYTLVSFCWDIQDGGHALEELSKPTQGLIAELNFESISILDRVLFPPDQERVKREYAEIIHKHLAGKYPHLMDKKDEKWWLYHFQKDSLPYIKRV